ncbi:FecR family protein [Blastopirellula sp. J2-11]|uniref:FecR family protein n=1 Tax=Blastopirellula sp. J2-11 TaxID=2943192 RepID=UPI0021CA5D5A|nr:FecR family protein [Blastopirellula sp. J2-11]UUO07172.1 FecR family protein [Blastopirellula sp. J2-11]
MNLDSQKQFEQLWNDFLEGELEEADADQLCDLLAADEKLRETAIELYQTHRLLGLVMQEEPAGRDGFVESAMQEILRRRENFGSRAMQRIRQQTRESSTSSATLRPQQISWRSLPTNLIAASVLAISLLCLVWLTGFSQRPEPEQPPVAEKESQAPSVAAPPSVKFLRVAKARFFGELTPAALSETELEKSYVLMSGMVELLFPGGAHAIIEGPAVFRAEPENCLAMNLGRCSVHAPDGAEGFRVETPDSQVVDRGTRFTVDVSEFNETKIQVVEGIADIYENSSKARELRRLLGNAEDFNEQGDEFAPIVGNHENELRLESNQAVKVLAEPTFTLTPGVFDRDKHRMRLPDRIVSFTATTAESDGKAELLKTVTVQRAGQDVTYSDTDLIPVELIWFRSSRNEGLFDHVLGGKQVIGKPIDALSDNSIVTGVINPGGSETPLQSNPVMEHAPADNVIGTPGMAVRFAQPVKNGPGPDVVFFEIHPLPSLTDGDAFHVCPLQMSPGRKAHTIREYDLSLYSPEALPVTQMLVHATKGQRIDSLTELEQADFTLRPVRLEYRALAVGIDLSDLGYAPGEAAEGLFFQDADDNEFYVDPVLIGGLP